MNNELHKFEQKFGHLLPLAHKDAILASIQTMMATYGMACVIDSYYAREAMAICAEASPG
jgi:hypothetical protein